LKYLEAGGSAVALNLGTGKGFSVSEILAAAEKTIGRSVPVVKQARRPGDPPVLVAASHRAREVLGWQPTRSSVDHILETAWRWLRGHRGAGALTG
jgi:UDP-glucose 4-epimerase